MSDTDFKWPDDVPALIGGLIVCLIMLWVAAMLAGVGVILTRILIGEVF